MPWIKHFARWNVQEFVVESLNRGLEVRNAIDRAIFQTGDLKKINSEDVR
jgi:hypothetical protein